MKTQSVHDTQNHEIHIFDPMYPSRVRIVQHSLTKEIAIKNAITLTNHYLHLYKGCVDIVVNRKTIKGYSPIVVFIVGNRDKQPTN